MAIDIALNIPMVDWLQVTSFSGHLYDRGVEYWKKSVGEIDEKANVLQYSGWRAHFQDGTFFCGSALMGDRPNNMIVATSSRADSAFMEFTRVQSQINVPRIDLQITVKKPHWYHQSATMGELEKSGTLSGMRRSQARGQDMMTLYCGSQESDQFSRTYEKLTESDEKLIRFECVIRDKRAWTLVRKARFNEGERMREIFAGYLMKRVFTTRSQSIRTLFEKPLREWSTKTHTAKIERVRTSEDTTTDWIMNSCVPSISRILNSETADRKIEVYNVLSKLCYEFEEKYLPR